MRPPTKEPGPRPRARGLLPLLLVLLAAACGEGAARSPRLVLLYAPCSVNKDFLSPYDPGVPFTPNLQAFAADSVVFERHNNEAGQSGIDYAALFSGVQADRHGVFCHPKRLSPDLFQISEAFAAEGWETHFWSGQQMGAWNLGYGQGVPRRNAHVHTHEDIDAYTANDEDFDAILERLASDPEHRAFVQVNFTVTHNPYHSTVTPEEAQAFVERFPDHAPGLSDAELARYVALYDANRLPLEWNFAAKREELGLSDEDVEKLARTLEFFYEVRVYQLDTLFGRLLERIRASGLLDESVIAFTADHGEILYRDNALFQWTHGNQLAPEVLHVPWILRAPSFGVAPGRYEGVTRSIDVFPTLCGVAGVSWLDALVDGVDLSPALRGEEPPPRLIAWSHTTTIDKRYDHLHRGTLLRALNPRDDPTLIWVRARDGDMVWQHRYLGDGAYRFEAFDLASDPGERVNLWDPDDPDCRRMARDLQAYRARLVAGYYENNAAELPRSEADERLRALGYIGEEDAAR